MVSADNLYLNCLLHDVVYFEIIISLDVRRPVYEDADEYFIRGYIVIIHFECTSDDVNTT